MAFLDEVEFVEKKSGSKSKTMKELLMEAIAKNKEVLEGKVVSGTKSGTKFNSWFKDGMMIPKVGVNNLFTDKKGIKCAKGQEKILLKKFEDAFNKGEFDALLSKIEKNKATSKTKKP